MLRDLHVHQALTDSDLPPNIVSMFSCASRSEIDERAAEFFELALRHLSQRDPSPFPFNTHPKEIERHFLEPMPINAEPLNAILYDLRTNVLPHCSNKRAPGYFAQMDVPPTDLSVFSGLLIRAIAQDPISFTSSRSGTFVEKQVSSWLTDLIFPGLPAAGGVMTSGGSQSNLQAILLLRNSAFLRVGVDVNACGLSAALNKTQYKRIAFVVSGATHQSVRSAIRFTGLGDDAALVVDQNLECLTPKSLIEVLRRAESDDTLVAGVVLTAGTTGCGSIDPLDDAIAIANEFHVPVHVDAAHGGMLLFSKRHKHALKGISSAASVTFDPHKILGINQSLGFLAVRQKNTLSNLGKAGLAYYNPATEPDLGDHSLDTSRTMNSLGAWIVMRSVGLDGYACIVDYLLDLSSAFRHRITSLGAFAVLDPGPMNVVAFRPGDNHQDSVEDGDAIVERLISHVLQDGRYAISRYHRENGRLFARAVFVNPASTLSQVNGLADLLLDEMRRARSEQH